MTSTQETYDRLRRKLHWEQNKIFNAIRFIGTLEYSTDDYLLLEFNEGRYVITKEQISHLIDILRKKEKEEIEK